MALYSAFDWDRNSYRVYRTPELVSVGDDPTPPRPRLRHRLGAVPDVDAKPLPAGAKTTTKFCPSDPARPGPSRCRQAWYRALRAERLLQKESPGHNRGNSQRTHSS